MREIVTKVYQYEELSDRAKENARDWYRIHGFDYKWWVAVCEDAKMVGAIIGIEIDDIWFSGFSNQGDGALFEGVYRYRKGWREELRGSIGGDDLREIEAIGQDLQNAQKRVFYSAEASTSQRGHYCHSGCMSVNVDMHEDIGRDVFTEVEIEIIDALRRFADWIYRSLEKEYDFLSSDEEVAETIISNEYEFDEDGNRVTV